MNSETEDFLDSVRGAEDPTHADARRVLAGVKAKVAAGAAVDTTAPSSKLARLSKWSTSGGFKGGAAVLVLVAAAAAGITAATRVDPSGSAVNHAEGRRIEQQAPVARLPPAPAALPPAPAALPPAPAALPPAPAALPPAPTVPAPSASSQPLEPPFRAAPPAPSARERAVPAVASLRDELAVLSRAQAALRQGDAAQALRALDAASPGSPQLAAEHATLRILALCGLGRVAEARRTASELEHWDAGTLQRDVISRSCAGSAPPVQP